MNRALPLLAIVLLAPAGVSARDAGADPDLAQVVRLERSLWNAWKALDENTIVRLSAADYYSISEEGPGKAVGLAEIKQDLRVAHIKDFRLGEMAARRLGPDTIFVGYNAHIFGSASGKDISRGVAEGSIWVRRDGHWLNVVLHEVTRSTRDPAVDP
jgi:hypothetical protein